MRLGKVIKSNSHCDYVAELDTAMDVKEPPKPDQFGFGSFVAMPLPTGQTIVGVIYNTLIHNPAFRDRGPRLSSEIDLMFTPDLVTETSTLLGVLIIGELVTTPAKHTYGVHGIPRTIVPINAVVNAMSLKQVSSFHRDRNEKAYFHYYAHLLKSGGHLASTLLEQVMNDLITSEAFNESEAKALHLLCKNLAWKSAVSAMS